MNSNLAVRFSCEKSIKNRIIHNIRNNGFCYSYIIIYNAIYNIYSNLQCAGLPPLFCHIHVQNTSTSYLLLNSPRRQASYDIFLQEYECKNDRNRQNSAISHDTVPLRPVFALELMDIRCQRPHIRLHVKCHRIDQVIPAI